MERPRAGKLLATLLVILMGTMTPQALLAQRPFPIQFKPKGFVPKHTRYAAPASHAAPSTYAPSASSSAATTRSGANRPVQPVQYQESAVPSDMGEMIPQGTNYDPGFGEEVIYEGDAGMASSGGDWYGPRQGFSPLWGRAEYLHWWTKGMNVPPLATTSDVGTNQDQAGVLGLATTDIVFGNSRVNEGSRSGGRFTLGWWMDPAEMSGLEANYLVLGDESAGFSADEDDFAILARPFFNTTLNAEDSRLLAFPNLTDGSVTMDLSTSFDGAEVNYRRGAVRTGWTEIDYLIGYRYASLDDHLRIDETSTALSGPVVGSRINLFDQFDAANSFHGGQLGMRVLRQAGPGYTLEFLGKFAVGGTRTRATINGQTVTTPAGGTAATTTGGLLALPTNIGTFADSEFSTITEAGATLRHQLTAATTISIGYSLLYWSDVARVGEMIDTRVNPSQIPPSTLTGDRRPAFRSPPTDFWAQGLNLGFEFRF